MKDQWNGEMKLEGAKKLQNVFKSNLNEISRRDINQKSKKVHWEILNCYTNHENLLLNYLMIILQFHLKLNTKQFTEKNSKYVTTHSLW